MLTRVVVVVFFLSGGLSIAHRRADAQVTQPVSPAAPDAAPAVAPDRVLPPTAVTREPAPATAAPSGAAQPPAPLDTQENVSTPPAADASAPAALTTQPLVTTPPASTRPTNRSAEETLRQMLQPQGASARPLRPAAAAEAPPAVDETSGAGAVAPGGTPQRVAREGTLLLDRVGRITRREDGRTFEFTIDADGRGMTDAPMILVPNRRLQQLEDRVQGSYRDLKIRVSGEVMEYRGRNYLLLQRWSVIPDVAQPLQ